jgi:hypothetical protein
MGEVFENWNDSIKNNNITDFLNDEELKNLDLKELVCALEW